MEGTAMDERKVLFVYDCDGTIIGPSVFVWALAKKEGKTTETLSEFKKKHSKKAMIPGMEELIRWTAKDGINVLISGGDPEHDGCPELTKLKEEGLFTDWKCDGKDVPWGKEPVGYLKDDPKVAEGLLKYFNPQLVVVIGDSASEYILALRMKAVGYIHRGTAIDDEKVLRETLSQEIPDLKFPNILYAQTGKTMQQEIMRRKQMIRKPGIRLTRRSSISPFWLKKSG